MLSRLVQFSKGDSYEDLDGKDVACIVSDPSAITPDPSAITPDPSAPKPTDGEVKTLQTPTSSEGEIDKYPSSSFYLIVFFPPVCLSFSFSFCREVETGTRRNLYFSSGWLSRMDFKFLLHFVGLPHP